jgi:hypothetical protein
MQRKIVPVKSHERTVLHAMKRLHVLLAAVSTAAAAGCTSQDDVQKVSNLGPHNRR